VSSFKWSSVWPLQCVCGLISLQDNVYRRRWPPLTSSLVATCQIYGWHKTAPSNDSRRAEPTEWVYYAGGDESVIMTNTDAGQPAGPATVMSASAAVCISVASASQCCPAGGDLTDRILPDAHCQSAPVYHSTPVRTLIAASSAADADAAAAAVAAGTTRSVGAQHIIRPSVPVRRHPIFPRT